MVMDIEEEREREREREREIFRIYFCHILKLLHIELNGD